jgi:release factor glutamine methyltransferase
MVTLKAILEEATEAIGRVDAHALVANLLGVNRAYLIANPMRVLTETEAAKIESMVVQRVLGQPVAYLLARREFYGRDFAVSGDVLIPRPETEILVAAVLAAGLRSGAAVLDLGAGSGAIAVTLACERPDLQITATDVSEGALKIAKMNALDLGCAPRVEFLRGSWYAPVAARRFDAIVSNPPYIAKGDVHLGQGDLRFEPGTALCDGSADGLDSIRAIVAGAREHLNPGGALFVEHGYDQAAAVEKLFSKAGFDDLQSTPDLAGIPRVASGKMRD